MDEYFIEICAQSKTDEVDFHETGGWKEYHEKKEKEPPKEKKKDKAIVLHSKYLCLSY